LLRELSGLMESSFSSTVGEFHCVIMLAAGSEHAVRKHKAVIVELLLYEVIVDVISANEPVAVCLIIQKQSLANYACSIMQAESLITVLLLLL